jgi:hypothetical protein
LLACVVAAVMIEVEVLMVVVVVGETRRFEEEPTVGSVHLRKN